MDDIEERKRMSVRKSMTTDSATKQRSSIKSISTRRSSTSSRDSEGRSSAKLLGKRNVLMLSTLSRLQAAIP